MSATSQSSFFSSDVRDVFLWRRKKLSFLVLSAATTAWVLLDVYQFNFVTVISWAAILIVTALFLYGNLIRLVRKEEPSWSSSGISEQGASRIANYVRESFDEGVRWMLRVSAESEWFLFTRVVAALWLLSYLGCRLDLLTLLFVGIVAGMTFPVMYVKNEDKVKRCEEWVTSRTRSFFDMVDEKVFKKIKNKVAQVQGHRKEEEEKKED